MVLNNLERYLWLVFNICHLNAFELSSKYESLTHIFETYNEGPGLDHFWNYAPEYDENINQLRKWAVSKGKKVKMVEIGVQSGGSTRVWKRYFRGTLEYIGIDINPKCKQFESIDEGIRIEIGSQLSTKFLSSLCSTYGPFDLVVDDGGHTNEMISTSLASLWPCLNDNAVYVIEDLYKLTGQSNSLDFAEESIYTTVSHWMKVRSPSHKIKSTISPDYPGWYLKKLAYYDSILFLHYGEDIPKLERFKKGSNWIPYKKNHTLDTPNCVGCCIGCYDD